MIRRRQLLAGAGAGALAGLLPAWARSATTAPSPAALSGEEIALTIGHAPIAVDGRRGHAVAINGTVPGPLIRLKEAGWVIHIASMTPGDCGSMVHNRWDIASIRTKENTAAAKIMGGTYHCLDERDLMVVFDKPTIQKCIDLMRRVKPDLVITHAPKDYMMDHEMTSLLARAASFGFGAPNASQFPRLEGSHVPHLYYCDPVAGVNPYGNPSDRGWQPLVLDLSPFAGENVDLVFNTYASPPPNTERDRSGDAALWGAPRIVIR